MLLPLNPLSNVARTVDQLNASSFLISEEPNYVDVNQRHLTQIDSGEMADFVTAPGVLKPPLSS
ncbi:MAG: hypothetical protein QOF72_345 [Blastocatellia bacterium]|nr:hypothetical protein [Blastocatellia bacterium]